MNRVMKRSSGFIPTNIFLFGFLFLFSSSAFANNNEKKIFEAENAKAVGGASKLTDNSASGKYLANLTKAGQFYIFNKPPPTNKLSIRYASLKVGTISVAINNQKTT